MEIYRHISIVPEKGGRIKNKEKIRQNNYASFLQMILAFLAVHPEYDIVRCTAVADKVAKCLVDRLHPYLIKDWIRVPHYHNYQDLVEKLTQQYRLWLLPMSKVMDIFFRWRHITAHLDDPSQWDYPLHKDEYEAILALKGCSYEAVEENVRVDVH